MLCISTDNGARTGVPSIGNGTDVNPVFSAPNDKSPFEFRKTDVYDTPKNEKGFPAGKFTLTAQSEGGDT